MDASAKKKDVPSGKEDKPAAKKRPIKVIQVEDISVPIFAFENEGAGGEVRVNYSWTVSRSYKDADGEVHRTSWFGLDDCGKVLAAVKQASEYIHGLQQAEPATEPAA